MMMLIMARIEIPAKEKCFFFMFVWAYTLYLWVWLQKKMPNKKIFMHQYQRIFCFFLNQILENITLDLFWQLTSKSYPKNLYWKWARREKHSVQLWIKKVQKNVNYGYQYSIFELFWLHVLKKFLGNAFRPAHTPILSILRANWF